MIPVREERREWGFHREHASPRLQEVVPRVDVCLQHALVDQQGAHGLRNQDVHPLIQLKLLNLAVQHFDPAPNPCEIPKWSVKCGMPHLPSGVATCDCP